MLCGPVVNATVVNIACPEVLSGPVPNAVTPSLKITFPVGTPPLEITVAVKVTDWPSVDGLNDEVKVVVVENLTVCVKADDPDAVLLAKFGSPP